MIDHFSGVDTEINLHGGGGSLWCFAIEGFAYLLSSGVSAVENVTLSLLHILYFVKFSFAVFLSYQKEPLHKIWFLCYLKFDNLSIIKNIYGFIL